jgi:LPS-assembly protein
LDTNAGRGTARHATLRIRNLPVFYSPYLTFPLDDRRKSGFLVPRWGNTETNGADITLPFYWNIAPNYDLTLFPRYMRKRGLMLGGEFRYLGETYDGSLFGSYLNDDDVFGDDRWAYSIRHNYAPTPRWTANIDYNKVSDDEYLQDFGNSIRFSSIAQLNQRGEVAYRGNGWRARGRIVKFQNVDPAISVAREPYERVPDFTFKGDWARQKFGLSYGLLADATWFEHPVNDLSEDNPERTPQPVKVNGTRLFMRPSVSYPFLRTWGFALPKLSLDFASYSLEDNRRVRTIRRENRPNRIRVTPLSNSITRTTPMFSFDTGLFFDRPIELGGNQLTQTLEPRLFYLYVPLEEDQNEIPRYDTDNVSQNYDFLFRESRFTGPDRLGDANQLTTAISTRILRDGRELFSASIGQIQYFRDREVTLSGIPDTRSASDVIAESSLRLRRRWSVRAGINYDTFANEVVKGRADLRYNPKAGRVLNVGYRFTRDDLEQTDVSGTWPLSHRWRLMGRWNQSIRDSLLLELLMGLEYQDCCWAVRVAGRRYRNGTEDPDIKNAIFFEVELKGLAGLGTNLRSLFSERIPGYVTEY